ncbi:flagellar basal body rod protein FlgB [Oxobacter pfennigii]|uniref:Flagellar basal body rod protein FlgB n=1 Tax=Oxobacter pfennigii TaxID=36849 RepID=A0A0P8W9M8_9CLOT|nr:flagellar basal body rod protein FlgB [Oxobacter pfennigii]KPU44684.1 flagellar basal body rod protein FlgB [Oxobacter pfennigii]
MSDLTYKLIKKTLDAGALRQKVIANNIANINNKNFKRSDVVFEETLKDELNRIGRDKDKVDSLKPEVIKDESSNIRMDGNNVDIDTEMSNMAANNILYNTMITQLNTKLSVLRHIISEGRK